MTATYACKLKPNAQLNLLALKFVHLTQHTPYDIGAKLLRGLEFSHPLPICGGVEHLEEGSGHKFRSHAGGRRACAAGMAFIT